jgi:hypothetical protein
MTRPATSGFQPQPQYFNTRYSPAKSPNMRNLLVIETAEITDIKGVARESVWVASKDSGAAQFHLTGNEVVSMQSWGSHVQGGLSANDIRSIATDRDGSVWFATSTGLFRYQPWAFQPIDDRIYSLPVNDLLFDRKGQLWIATAGEGVQLRAERYQKATVFTSDNSELPSDLVFNLEEDAAWSSLGNYQRRCAYFDAQRWQRPLAPSLNLGNFDRCTEG